MEENLNKRRRQFLKIAIGAAAVGGVGGVGLTGLALMVEPEYKPRLKEKKLKAPSGGDIIWPYVQLNAEDVAQKAYESFLKGECMYGVFNAVISSLAEKIGEPYSTFPTDFMSYGFGGVVGYGTLCGTLNGAAALFSLLIPDKEAKVSLTDDLFRWYEQTPLPQWFKPLHPVFDYKPTSIAVKTVLCHASTTTWAKEAGVTIVSDERKERCKCLTAEVAAQTVSMLNKYFEGHYIAHTWDGQSARECMSCHGPSEMVNNTLGKMDCRSCHEESFVHRVLAAPHQKIEKIIHKK